MATGVASRRDGSVGERIESESATTAPNRLCDTRRVDTNVRESAPAESSHRLVECRGETGRFFETMAIAGCSIVQDRALDRTWTRHRLGLSSTELRVESDGWNRYRL
ncbi:hypothetical protein C478_06114 [Natrinema thermotolerans DSM 11552]|nr:hypothetical protein C478_06114 [Natrinema thermotolerans DSM 11552]